MSILLLHQIGLVLYIQGQPHDNTLQIDELKHFRECALEFLELWVIIKYSKKPDKNMEVNNLLLILYCACNLILKLK